MTYEQWILAFITNNPDRLTTIGLDRAIFGNIKIDRPDVIVNGRPLYREAAAATVPVPVPLTPSQLYDTLDKLEAEGKITRRGRGCSINKLLGVPTEEDAMAIQIRILENKIRIQDALLKGR